MKRDPPENIFYSVHIALLNIFPKPGLVRVSRLVYNKIQKKEHYLCCILKGVCFTRIKCLELSQPQLNLTLGLTQKWLCTPPIHPPTYHLKLNVSNISVVIDKNKSKNNTIQEQEQEQEINR